MPNLTEALSKNLERFGIDFLPFGGYIFRNSRSYTQTHEESLELYNQQTEAYRVVACLPHVAAPAAHVGTALAHGAEMLVVWH